MHATLFVMSASFFNPSFAFSSHFDPDSAPLSELSWSSSLAVVAVSFSGLFTFIFLMLACLCCKKGDIGFKEFENTEGEEYQAEFSTLASSTSQTGPEVYVLPLTEVSLPVSKQPGRSVQLLKSTDLGRHSLLYLKEIGHGWFGKVLLGEVNASLSTTQVVVKELKASASVQDQMQFLEEVQPYRSLQHPHVLQCLAQCTEVTPYLLVMEFCPLGDLKGYLRSCRAADSMTPDPLTLQRMACEIASGLLHLHKCNFVHSDLALRNCLLTAEVTVKIGDYGLSHNKYKDDYFVTVDQVWLPLRWIAPELIDEVHGNLLVVDQTKPSNIWSLGVTIWELFELGNQPYRHYSDRQVLTYAVKEQQLKLPKPLLKLPFSERWYEVLQFCWLQPDQRPTAEEVHLLLSYLCAKGASEAEEDFEKRWNSLRPNSGNSSTHSASASVAKQLPSSSSSFPLLENFSGGDGFHSEAGDDILTVTETSRGLNFEYKWEQARPEQHYPSSSSSGTLGHSQYQDIYYAPGGRVSGSSCSGGLSLGVSPSYYDSKPSGLHTPGIVPMLSAHSPSVSNEYYIRMEEPSECNIDLDYTMCSYSPELGGSNGSFIGGGGGSGDCDNCPSEAQPNSYWLEEACKASAYDSDTSLAISLTMEPLLGQMSTASPVEPWESEQYYSYKVQEKEQGYYYDQSSLDGADHYLLEDSSENHRESWGSRSLRQALGELEDPLGVSPSLGGPQQLYRDPYIEGSRPALSKRSAGECYYDMTGSLRKNVPGSNMVCVDMEEEDSGLFIGRRDSDLEEVDMFVEKEALVQANHWTSNSSANNNSLSKRSGNNIQDGYANFNFTMPSAGFEESWRVFKSKENLTYPASQSFPYLEAATCTEGGRIPLTNEHKLFPSSECNSYTYPCHEEEERMSPPEEHNTYQEHGFVDPLLGSVVRSYSLNDYIKQKQTVGLKKENGESSPSTTLGGAVSSNVVPETELNPDLVSLGKAGTPVDKTEQSMNTVVGRKSSEKEEENEDCCLSELKHPAQNSMRSVQSEGLTPEMAQSTQSELDSETSRTAESGMDKGCSSISLVEIDDCSDDDITDVTSGVFTNFPMDYVGDAPPAVKSLQKQAGTPDSIESLDLPSTSSFCESFSPSTFHPSSQPKAIDSGYDTENYESPEFVLKEPHDSRDPEGFVQPLEKPSVSEVPGLEETETEVGAEVCPGVPLSTSHSTELGGLNEKNPYRDSAYFSDYDAENEKYSRDEGDKFPEKLDDDIIVPEPGKEGPIADPASLKVEEKEPQQQKQQQENHVDEKDQLQNDNSGRQFDEQNQRQDIEDGGEILATPEVLEAEFATAHSTPTPSSLTPPEIEDEGLELEPELCRDEQYSEICTSSIPEEAAQPEHPGIPDEVQEPGSLEGPLVETSGSAMGGGASKNKTETSDCREEGDGGEPAEDTTSTGIPIADDSPQQPHSNCPDVESRGKEDPGEASECQMGRVSLADGEEADEEDRDSEDSEESDEELRCYNIQEQSEESEEELPAVSIVVSDSSEAHNLRSLLKMPSLLSQSFCEELDRKKKAVSFFDDVTVYLFDQESPTRELGDHSFPQGEESSGQSSETGETRPQERVRTSDDSSDGNVSEESGGFEWDDDFPLMPVSSSPMSSLGPSPMNPPVAPSLSPIAPESKQGPAVQYSRFTVSPSSVSRFSITHVSNSDVDSVGGSSEDGERE